jgi:hypothetical protein
MVDHFRASLFSQIISHEVVTESTSEQNPCRLSAGVLF